MREIDSAVAGDGLSIVGGTMVVWTETDDWGPVVAVWEDDGCRCTLADVALAMAGEVKLIDVADLAVCTDQGPS